MIRVLDDSMINKIAAGEVVERPASIVKELVENSIDAKAKNITLEIKDGGISYIRVTDNGSGIPEDYVKTAFLRHATSKIQNIDDLINVLTLGFRGEALSSIAAVSQVEMITKTSNALTAKRIEIHGEKIVSEQEVGALQGTNIIIRNIFFNIPARRKFLKKPATESAYISEIINRFALANPDISFKFINNNSILLETNGNGDLKIAILEVYGKETAKNIINLNYKKEFLEISGYIGKPEISRNNRKYQNVFLNGRYIKSELISSAVEEAYKTKLTVGKFPFFILNLKTLPDKVDVNVHPSKLEVRFEDEDLIYNSVLDSVKSALNSEILIPSQKFDIPKKQETKQIEIKDFSFETDDTNDMSELIINQDYLLKEEAVPYIIEEKNNEPDIKVIAPAVNIEIPLKKEENISPKQEVFFNNYKIIGQLFNTYWVIEQSNEIYYIDQHAAHERILYEELINRIKTQKPYAQALISPIIFNLTHSEFNTVTENIELLNEFGFEVEEFGKDSVAIRSVPLIFSKPENVNFFTEIIDMLSDISTAVDNVYDLKLNNIATISCKAAVKANDRLDFVEAKEIIRKLLKLENPFTCPHGRPTIIKMSKYELEKKFKRIQ